MMCNVDSGVCASCATTIDHIATYVFLNMKKETPPVQRIRAHLSSEPELMNQFMATLMNSLLFASQSSQWAITRPILSVMLASEASFTCYKEQLLATQSPENQAKLLDEFAKLTADIQRSVDTLNRDRFTQKLSVFRLNVRQFLTL